MARNSRTRVTIEYNHFAEIALKLPVAAMAIVAETLAEIDATVQIGMAAGGRGRVYTRGGIPHRASAPGDSPATDLGNLAGSIQTELNRSKHKGYIFTSAEYAPHLEYGTTTILPRPFLTPAAERARPGFVRKMKHLESRLR